MPRPYAATLYAPGGRGPATAVSNMSYGGRTASGWYSHIPAPDLSQIPRIGAETGKYEGMEAFYKALDAERKARKDKQKEKEKAKEDLGNEPESEGFWSKLGDFAVDGFNRVMDVASRFNYGSANVAKYLTVTSDDAPDEEKNFWEKLVDLPDVGNAWWRGFAGKDKTTFGQVIAQNAAEDHTKNILDYKWFQGAAGFAGDVLLDPTTYIGVGLVTKPLKGLAKKGLEEVSQHAATLGKFADDVHELNIKAVHPHSGKEINLTRDVVYGALGGRRMGEGKLLNSGRVTQRVKAKQAQAFTDSWQFIHDAIRRHPDYETQETIKSLNDQMARLKDDYNQKLNRAGHDAYRESVTEQAAKKADKLPVGPEEFAQELGDIIDSSLELSKVQDAFKELAQWSAKAPERPPLVKGMAHARRETPAKWEAWDKLRHQKLTEFLDDAGFNNDPRITDEFKQSILNKIDETEQKPAYKRLGKKAGVLGEKIRTDEVRLEDAKKSGGGMREIRREKGYKHNVQNRVYERMNRMKAKRFMTELSKHVDNADWTKIDSEYRDLEIRAQEIHTQLRIRGAHDRTPGLVPEMKGTKNTQSRIERESVHDFDSSGEKPQDVTNVPGAPVGPDKEGAAFDETQGLKDELNQIKQRQEDIKTRYHEQGVPLETPKAFQGDVSRFLQVDEHGIVTANTEKLSPESRRWVEAIQDRVQDKVDDYTEIKRQSWFREQRAKKQYSARDAHFKDAFGGRHNQTPKIHIDGEEYLLSDLNDKSGKGQRLRQLLESRYGLPDQEIKDNAYQLASYRENALKAYYRSKGKKPIIDGDGKIKSPFTNEQMKIAFKATDNGRHSQDVPAVVHRLLSESAPNGKVDERISQELGEYAKELSQIRESFDIKAQSGAVFHDQWGDIFDEAFQDEHGVPFKELKEQYRAASDKKSNKKLSPNPSLSQEHAWAREGLKKATTEVNEDLASGKPIKSVLDKSVSLQHRGISRDSSKSENDVNQIHEIAKEGVEQKHEDSVLAVVADSPVGQKFLPKDDFEPVNPEAFADALFNARGLAGPYGHKITLALDDAWQHADNGDWNSVKLALDEAVRELKAVKGMTNLNVKDPERLDNLLNVLEQVRKGWGGDGLKALPVGSSPKAAPKPTPPVGNGELLTPVSPAQKKAADQAMGKPVPSAQQVVSKVNKAAKKNPNDPELQALKAKIDDLQRLKDEEIATLDQAHAEALKTREALADRMKEQITLNMLEESLVEGKNWIALKLPKGIDIAIIPDFLHLTEATQRIATLPIIQAANKVWSQAFHPASTLEPELNLARLRAQSQTPQVIEYQVERLRKAFGKYNPTERRRALKALKSGGKLRSELSDQLQEEFDAFLPYVQGKVELPTEGGHGQPEHLAIRELNRFLPEEFQIKHREGYSDENIHIANTGQLLEHLRRLKPNADPLQVLWRLRIASEQALAHKAMLINVREMFGVKRVLGKTDKAHAQQQELIEDLHHMHDWRDNRDIGPEYYFAPEMADQIDKLMTLMKPQNIHEITRLYDKALRGLKSFMTVWNIPGYYTRNAIGETLMGMFDGVGGGAYREAARVMRYGTTDEVKEALTKLDPWSAWSKNRPTGNRTVMKLPHGGPELSEADIWVLYHQAGLKTGFISQEFEHYFPKSGTLASTPVGRLGKTVNDFARDKGEKFEDYFRMAHFVSRLSRSKLKDPVAAAEDAANYVRKYHFDYTDFTPFEKTTMMRIFPFYKWTRKALPLMTSMLFTRPGLAMFYPKAMQNVSYGMGGTDPLNDQNGFLPNYEKVTPEWVKGLFAYPMGRDEEGSMTYANVANPAFDVYKMLRDPVGTGVGMLNPMIKNPIEQIQGNTMDPSFKIEFEDAKYEGGQTGWSKRLDNLMRITPQGSYINQLQKGPGWMNENVPGPHNADDESRWSEPGAPADERTASFFSGLGFYENNDDAKFGELQRKMEKGTITQFERHRLGDLLHKYKEAANQ